MFKFNNQKNYAIITLKKKLSSKKLLHYKHSKQNKKMAYNNYLTSCTTEKLQTKHYNLQRSQSSYQNVMKLGHPLKKKIKLSSIRHAKKQYCDDLIQAVNVLENGKILSWHWFKKRLNKFLLSFLLIGFVATAGIFAADKYVTLIIDGVEQKTKTTTLLSSMFGDKVAQDYNFKDYKLDTEERVLSDGDKIEIRNLKTIDVKVKDKQQQHKTYSNTLDELYKELTPNLNQFDGKYSYYSKEYPANTDKVFLKDKKDLEIYLMSKRTWQKTITKKYKTKYVKNSKLDSGELKVKQKGKVAKYVRQKEVVYLNDKAFKVNVTVSKVIQKGQVKIVERGTKATSGSTVWDRLAKCETGGRWHLNNGNGFYGGLQFSAGTWRTASGKVGVSAPYAHLASKSDQIKAATWLQKNSGWGQWPACTSKLGLR